MNDKPSKDGTCSKKITSVNKSKKICCSVEASALQFQQVMSMYVMHNGPMWRSAARQPENTRGIRKEK